MVSLPLRLSGSAALPLLSALFCLSAPLRASDTLFVEDFSGNLSSNWIFFGDPPPRIEDSLGLPPPAFLNNGDAVRGSGAVSREIFRLGPGFFVECDIYLSCHERGTWVTARLEIVTPGFRNEGNSRDYSIARMDLSYSGEMDWSCPHRQAVLSVGCFHDPDTRFNLQTIHQNQLLDGWHKFRMGINEDRTVSYFIDDSLWCVSPISIPDTVANVRIKLGDRSSDWGIALHDNILVCGP